MKLLASGEKKRAKQFRVSPRSGQGGFMELQDTLIDCTQSNKLKIWARIYSLPLTEQQFKICDLMLKGHDVPAIAYILGTSKEVIHMRFLKIRRMLKAQNIFYS